MQAPTNIVSRVDEIMPVLGRLPDRFDSLAGAFYTLVLSDIVEQMDLCFLDCFTVSELMLKAWDGGDGLVFGLGSEVPGQDPRCLIAEAEDKSTGQRACLPFSNSLPKTGCPRPIPAPTGSQRGCRHLLDTVAAQT